LRKTQKKTIAAILADKQSPLAEKVADYIICIPLHQLGALTAKKVAKLFEMPLDTLNTLFFNYQKRSIDQFILFFKMHSAHMLMSKTSDKRPKLKVMAEILGFRTYSAFVYHFRKFIPFSPQKIINIYQEQQSNNIDHEKDT
jgi:AraC-like DNA-binding protein